MFPIGALQLGLIVAIVIGCVALWNQIFALQSAGYDIVTYEPRRSVPWGPRDVVVILIGVVAIVNLCTLSVAWLTKHPKEPHDLAAETSEPAHDASHPVVPDTTPEGNGTGTEVTISDEEPEKKQPADKFRMIFSGACGTALSVLAAIFWLRLRGADRQDLGYGGAHMAQDLRLGVAGFVAASVPVYLVQIAAVQFIPAEHPVSDIFQSHPSVLTVLATALVAVVVAPLTEEFFFRVVLQGWLEALFAERHAKTAPLLPIDQVAPSPADNDVPLALEALAPTEQVPVVAAKPLSMPILLSSFIFAIVHLEYGPSAIPLFFFAVILGYLYRQTHRLWPSVIAHASLNAFSTFILVTTRT